MVSFRVFSIAAVVNFLATPMCALPLNSDNARFTTSISEKVLINTHTSVATSPKELAEGINGLTKKIFDLHAPAMGIKAGEGALIVVGLGPYPQIIRGLAEIVQYGNEVIGSAGGMKDITSSSDVDLVFNAYREFARVQQTLLSILTGKAGLIQSMAFVTSPVASALRILEGMDDSLGYSLTVILPDITGDVQTETASLAKAVEAAVEAHEVVPT